ncbi:MAG: polysaccharide biosynthesis/export family protein [Sphaerochaetaceae bacterium]
MSNWLRRFVSITILAWVVFPLLAADSPVFVDSPYFTFDQADTAQMQLDARTDSTLPDSATYLSQLGLGDGPDALEAISTPEERLRAAIASPVYPVTPGDVLMLSYMDSKTPVTLTVQVDGDCQTVIPNLGKIDGRGKTQARFIKEIGDLVLTYLPFSNPRCVLTATGSFSVLVKGEVFATREVPAWGLSRLSSVVGTATDYASTRQVLVTPREGKPVGYDLYKAMRDGDMTQNPLMKAGDVVTLVRAERIVRLSGLVLRPGTYQMLASETLDDLLALYGGGVLPSANVKDILVQRYGGAGNAGAMAVHRVDCSSVSRFALQDFDEVRVNRLDSMVGAISVEGALALTDTPQISSLLSSSARLFYRFYPGETVGEMLRALANRFTTVSDLAGAYLYSGDQLFPIDAQALLSGKNPAEATRVLVAGDRMIIPFNQLFVTVAGGVLKPGTFPYIPDKDATYYINLAGGFDRSKNRNHDYTVTAKDGGKLDEKAVVLPESVIYAEMNTFNAMNGQALANTAAVISLVSSIVMVVYYFAQVVTP